MRTVLKFIGFLLAMMLFVRYGQFVQATFASAVKADVGIGLVVAAISCSDPVAECVSLAPVLGEERAQCYCLSFQAACRAQDCQYNR